jgi:3-hydroxybutyryl-CoA dehydratase
MKKASFQVDVSQDDALAFAKVSGDWNPLHTDPAYATKTTYGRPLLHGAFSAGLFSRMAGMHLPGTECLLHNMNLTFTAPVYLPVSLLVTGEESVEGGDRGRVEATVSDAKTGASYVRGSYEFSLHRMAEKSGAGKTPTALNDRAAAPILVTGATGGLGQAVLEQLGSSAVGVSRSAREGMLTAPDVESLRSALGGKRIGGIVHCGWPTPDNERLLRLRQPDAAVDHHVAEPLRQMIGLAQLLAEYGEQGASLVLVGSVFSLPGRHNYRTPLYGLAKSMIPLLTRILAVELAGKGMRCTAVVFDVVDTGMNRNLSPAVKQSHADRVPAGQVASAQDAAAQIAWVLNNRSYLASGATITLTGGALP